MKKTYYNYKEYRKYILTKYEFSNSQYTKIFNDNESSQLFLYYYEGMNVYPTYSRPIIMPLKKPKDKFDLKINLNNNLTSNNNFNVNNSKFANLSNKVNEKLIEQNKYMDGIKKLRGSEKLRRFFDYEIRDKIKEYITDQKISNAWVKMYELLNIYNLFDINNTNNNVLKTFHLCEHPGAFVFSTNYFIKNILKKEHKFIYQSLRPSNYTTAFKPDPKLLKDFPNTLDYGPQDGDVTNKENILYYRKKYLNEKFHLITSDCGLSFSDDFTKQEKGMYRVFFGALISAIALSSQGTNYIFKMFSFNTVKSMEFLQIVCMFYERVDMVRVLTTKSQSGEIYCVCLNFNFKGNIDEIIKKLLSYMNSFNPDKEFLIDRFDNKFLKRLENNHNLLSMRRITTINSFIFRYLNFEYAKNKKIVRDMVKTYANYFVDYFLIINKLKSD